MSFDHSYLLTQLSLYTVPFGPKGPIYELCNVLHQLTNRVNQHRRLNAFDMSKNRADIVSLKARLATIDVNRVIKHSLTERTSPEILATMVKILDSSSHVKPMLNEASLKKLMIFKLKYKPS